MANGQDVFPGPSGSIKITTSLTPVVYTAGSYVLAQADATANTCDMVQLSDGTRLDSGVVYWPSHSLTIGSYYYLDQAVAGAMTDTIPSSGIIQRLLFVEDAARIHINVEAAF